MVGCINHPFMTKSDGRGERTCHLDTDTAVGVMAVMAVMAMATVDTDTDAALC